MKYQLYIDGFIYDHFRCTSCKITYLFPQIGSYVCYKNHEHRLHRTDIRHLSMYYINRLLVCNNCNFLGRIETYKDLHCPCCANFPMTPLKEIMKL